MNNESCILIDDEPHALGMLGDVVQKIPNLEERGRFFGILEALADLKLKGPVDFIFTDIEMPDLSGIEAAQQLRPYCKYLIFTTAFGQYALDAFGQFADGFLLKPIGLPAVLTSVEEIRQKFRHFLQRENEPDSIFVKTGGKHVFERISYDDIVCIDGDDHYPAIITASRSVSLYATMDELAQHFLQKKDFIRIRHNCIISIRKVTKIDGNKVYLALGQHNSRDVSQSYRKSFFDSVSPQVFSSKKGK